MTTAADPATTETIPATDQHTNAPQDTDPRPADTGDDTDPQPAAPTRPPLKDRLAHAITSWWAWIAEPMSLAEGWRRSGVVIAARVPAGSSLAAWCWWWSNRTDRVLLFAVLMITPTFLNGPVLWCAERPTRRWGLYLVLVLLGAITAGS